MELRHLRCFIALAEELHFGRAAQRMSITQPPLSAAIRGLEDELGVRLFERDSKQVRLTPAGREFHAEVQPVLDQVRRASDAARAIASGRQGYLEIGFTGSMAYRGVPQTVSAFAQSHPHVQVILREMSSAEALDALRHGRLHGAFINVPAAPDDLAAVALPDDCFVCCLPAGHPLADEPQIDLRRLAHDPFVMFAREVAPSNHDNVISICTAAGFHPVTRYAARQWLTIAALVANGLGVALVPAFIARSELAGARFVPIAGDAGRTGAFLLWREAPSIPAMEAFVAAVRSADR